MYEPRAPLVTRPHAYSLPLLWIVLAGARTAPRRPPRCCSTLRYRRAPSDDRAREGWPSFEGRCYLRSTGDPLPTW